MHYTGVVFEAESSTLLDLDDSLLARRIASAGREPAAAEEGELCRRYIRRLVYFGRRHLGADDAAQDLAQESLLLTLRKLRAGEVRDPSKIGAFILGVARTKVRERFRDPKRRHEPLEEASRDLPTVEIHLPDPIARERVVACLEELPDRQRTVLLLSFYAEQPTAEIGRSLGLEPGHLRVLRHRGISGLRQCLGLERGAARHE